MKYTIRGKNIEITEVMKTKTIGVFSKLTKFNNIIGDDNTLQIEVEHYKTNVSIIRATLNLVKNNRVLKSEVKHENFYHALDLSFSELKTQVLKLKDRLVTSNKRHPGIYKGQQHTIEINVDEDDIIDN